MTNAATKAFTDKHLNDAFFAKAIGNGLSTRVTINEVVLSPGTAPGENFCSDIFRAVVTFRRTGGVSDEEVSLIIKTMPFTEMRGPILEDLEVYQKEVNMYTDTLPLLSKLLGGERLAAKCYYATEHPVQIIVFEDLNASGFVMADRTAGLDQEHCKVVLQKLGKFHAASVVLVEQDPKAMRNYGFGMMQPDAKPNPVIDSLFVDGIKSVIQTMRTWPGYEGTVKKYEELKKDLVRKMDYMCNRSVPEYKVLNHGDLWVNNFLFKYDANGRPVDVCFVDYQMSFYTSPGHDLNYFINTSPQNEVREQKRDRILEFYHQSFAQTLNKLQSTQTSRLTLALLLEEVKARELYGLLASVGILPIVLMTKGGAEDMSFDAMADESAGEKIKYAMYNNPSYVRAMKHIVRRFDEEGVLDRVPDVSA